MGETYSTNAHSMPEFKISRKQLILGFSMTVAVVIFSLCCWTDLGTHVVHRLLAQDNHLQPYSSPPVMAMTACRRRLGGKWPGTSIAEELFKKGWRELSVNVPFETRSVL